MTKKIVVLFSLLLFLLTPIIVFADESSDLSQKITEYTQKLNQLGTAKNTLSNQIKILDSQIELTLLKIAQTGNTIKTLEKEISGLTTEIDKLNINLNDLSIIYINQVVQNYKLQKKVPEFAYIFSTKLNDFLEQHKYITILQKNSQNNLISLETVRTNYDLQKTSKEKKQTELEELKKTLAIQQANLNTQKVSKNSLLAATKNDEKKYQQLLNEAQRQLASLKSFSSSAGGSSCIAPNQPGGSDGNFYSQRDGRWCSQIINNSSDSTDTIGRIGCAISSYAMVMKKKNSDILPSAIAADPGNFDVYSRVLLNKIKANYHKGYSSSVIDSELSSGRYIIAELSAFGGTHFVVIINGSNGNYKIHDPWYGPDQNLNDHYSTGLIISLRIM